ncbi:hypothetical protein FOT62_21495 [Serratia marcescens]|uniref:Uncharacterized protein n=1 Tax=Serratia marcescens TaxID=615 RepID=A0A5C7C0P1_SERMA|nr:hypothetical protein [Serratia marcescens]TXE28342.1 hypothetical protein FOT62_21495 [Serratia marcescens]TXE56850.1 hypothetical protein FOT56_23560 [Serratia marcescens]
MLSEQPNKVSIHDELTQIHEALMKDEFSQMAKLPVSLRVMQELLEESHPSGYPSPESLRTLASYLRDEKFKVQREIGKNAPQAVVLQLLITRLKNLMAQAELARPEPPPSSGWFSRDWSHLSCMLPVFPALFMLCFTIVFCSIFIVDISSTTRLLTISVFLSLSLATAVFMKDAGMLFAVVLMIYFVALMHFSLEHSLI